MKIKFLIYVLLILLFTSCSEGKYITRSSGKHLNSRDQQALVMRNAHKNYKKAYGGIHLKAFFKYFERRRQCRINQNYYQSRYKMKGDQRYENWDRRPKSRSIIPW